MTVAAGLWGLHALLLRRIQRIAFGNCGGRGNLSLTCESDLEVRSGFFLTEPGPQEVRVGAEPDLELASGDRGRSAREPKGEVFEGFRNTPHIL